MTLVCNFDKTNHLAGTSNTKQPSDNTKKPKQQLMKTTHIYETKPNKTKAWFRSSFMPSSQETDWTYSAAPEPGRGKEEGKYSSSEDVCHKSTH